MSPEMCSFARKNEIVVREKIIIDSVERLGNGDTISSFALTPLSPLYHSAMAASGDVWPKGRRRTIQGESSLDSRLAGVVGSCPFVSFRVIAVRLRPTSRLRWLLPQD